MRELALLLVVHGGVGNPFAFRITSSRPDRAALAVAGNSNSARQNNLAAFLLSDPQGAAIDHSVRPHV